MGPRLTLNLTLTLPRSARRPREDGRRRRRRGARPTASSTSTGATTAGACPTVRWRAPGCGAPPTPRRRTARKRPHPRSSALASSERGCPLMPWRVHVLLLGLPVLVLRAPVCLLGARLAFANVRALPPSSLAVWHLLAAMRAPPPPPRQPEAPPDRTPRGNRASACALADRCARHDSVGQGQ